MGLELCPPETGLIKPLQDTNQPMDKWYYIAMEPITDRNGNPLVFRLERNADGAWLNDDWSDPGSVWNPDDEFVFRLRKRDLKT